MAERIVHLMRGLPSCGKSFTSQSLAGERGAIFETDAFFHTQVGSDPSQFDFDERLWPQARQWNFNRFTSAVDEGRSPIVVDRGNGLNLETQRYARYAVDRGYRVELAEPHSDWWREICVLLKYKEATWHILVDWADKLALRNRETHRTPASTILRWMEKWRHDLTVEQILRYRQGGRATGGRQRSGQEQDAAASTVSH